MRKFTAPAVLAVGALGVTMAVAHAEPGPAGPPDRVQTALDHQAVEIDGLHYTIDRDRASIVLAAADAHFRLADGRVLVEDRAGAFQDSVPLTYRMDDRAFPITAEFVDGGIKLTPATVGGVPVADPITPADIAKGEPIAESFTPRDATALGMLASRVGISSVIGASVGALLGAGGGCLAGAVVGSVSTAITTLLSGVLPGAIVGCIAGAAAIGSVGTLAGAALVAGPIVLWSAYQYFSTVFSPCYGPGAFCVDPAQPAPPPAK
ncbi:hypothetical protein [Nocardia sp. BMG111209]|uniref:hypothetical protein n=1 Tax=Nocardia sp. BMG111209 TaxID=1160137 RepID=UPI0003771C47|nr:hypothetical protein [Nocardia sp. BMG111209]